MGVNRFDKVINKPYVPAPYEEMLLAASLRQGRYDTAVQMEDQLEASIANIKAHPYHQEALDQINADYMSRIEGVYEMHNYDKGKAINNLKSLQRDFIQDLGTGDLGKIDRSYKTHVNTMTNLSALQEGGPDEGYHEFYTPGINNPYAVFDASQGFHESGELMEFKGGAWWKAEDAQAYYQPIFKDIPSNSLEQVRSLIPGFENLTSEDIIATAEYKEKTIEQIYDAAHTQSYNLKDNAPNLLKQHLYTLNNLENPVAVYNRAQRTLMHSPRYKNLSDSRKRDLLSDPNMVQQLALEDIIADSGAHLVNREVDLSNFFETTGLGASLGPDYGQGMFVDRGAHQVQVDNADNWHNQIDDSYGNVTNAINSVENSFDMQGGVTHIITDQAAFDRSLEELRIKYPDLDENTLMNFALGKNANWTSGTGLDLTSVVAAEMDFIENKLEILQREQNTLTDIDKRAMAEINAICDDCFEWDEDANTVRYKHLAVQSVEEMEKFIDIWTRNYLESRTLMNIENPERELLLEEKTNELAAAAGFDSTEEYLAKIADISRRVNFETRYSGTQGYTNTLELMPEYRVTDEERRFFDTYNNATEGLGGIGTVNANMADVLVNQIFGEDCYTPECANTRASFIDKMENINYGGVLMNQRMGLRSLWDGFRSAATAGWGNLTGRARDKFYKVENGERVLKSWSEIYSQHHTPYVESWIAQTNEALTNDILESVPELAEFVELRDAIREQHLERPIRSPREIVLKAFNHNAIDGLMSNRTDDISENHRDFANALFTNKDVLQYIDSNTGENITDDVLDEIQDDSGFYIFPQSFGLYSNHSDLAGPYVTVQLGTLDDGKFSPYDWGKDILLGGNTLVNGWIFNKLNAKDHIEYSIGKDAEQEFARGSTSYSINTVQDLRNSMIIGSENDIADNDSRVQKLVSNGGIQFHKLAPTQYMLTVGGESVGEAASSVVELIQNNLHPYLQTMTVSEAAVPDPYAAYENPNFNPIPQANRDSLASINFNPGNLGYGTEGGIVGALQELGININRGQGNPNVEGGMPNFIKFNNIEDGLKGMYTWFAAEWPGGTGPMANNRTLQRALENFCAKQGGPCYTTGQGGAEGAVNFGFSSDKRMKDLTHSEFVEVIARLIKLEDSTVYNNMFGQNTSVADATNMLLKSGVFNLLKNRLRISEN